MCGLTGFLAAPGLAVAALTATARGMADVLAHRGPDDAGVWVDAAQGVAFGHRRLSIVDLSPAGHQPMVSACGRFVIVLNGEVYNHGELRKELDRRALADVAMSEVAPIAVADKESRHREHSEAIQTVSTIAWRGHSDTETLLEAIAAWGLEAALRRAVGMFALALWDRKTRTLSLARDRMGEKPLYYGWVGTGERRAFAFGSELKALKAYPGFVNPLCRESLAQYFRFMCVPAPRTIYEQIWKLEPGTLIEIPADDRRAGAPLQPRAYWSLSAAVEAGERAPIMDERSAVDELEACLSNAVRLQLQADVPVGAFLSGGVDSSAIVALMQQYATHPVKTFTVGFGGGDLDEAEHGWAVAKHLGTDHAELFVTASEARSVIPQLPTMYDEPFADSSQIPTHIVCRAARQCVTVALSGDGGDELFGGYNRYVWGPRLWRGLAWAPHSLRRALAATIRALPPSGWSAMGRVLNRAIPGNAGVADLGDKAHKFAARIGSADSLDAFYRNLISVWPDPILLFRAEKSQRFARDQMVSSSMPRGVELDAPVGRLAQSLPSGLPDGAARMMYWDALTYMPDDILCKVDRAAMAISLETRAPYLDHRVVELAWRLPQSMKIRGSEGKWLLRQVLYKHVPRELIERPKSGFSIPVGAWLRGPLQEWAEDLLDESLLRRQGYLNPTPIRAAWSEHLSGRRDWTSRLWTVLMFQAWVA